jgi:predicted amidohydrolase
LTPAPAQAYDPAMDELRVALFQQAPRLGDPAYNTQAIARAAATAEPHPDVIITPELSLTGYDVRDHAHHLAVPRGDWDDIGGQLSTGDDTTILAGLIEGAPDGAVYNSAVAFIHGRATHAHRKVYLPTYGMFDEARYFARGATVEPIDVAGWRIGLLICEDFWHPGLVYALASAGIDALVIMAAAPGRGAWEGGENGDFASADAWERMARTTAQVYGIYVALANRVGVEGAVTFAGGSVIVGPDGRVVARADSVTECVITATFSRAEIRRARRPYHHGRDDDPAIVMNALEMNAMAPE